MQVYIIPIISEFRKQESCISQLLYITYEISANFNVCPSIETRAAFLDVS